MRQFHANPAARIEAEAGTGEYTQPLPEPPHPAPNQRGALDGQRPDFKSPLFTLSNSQLEGINTTAPATRCLRWRKKENASYPKSHLPRIAAQINRASGTNLVGFFFCSLSLVFSCVSPIRKQQQSQIQRRVVCFFFLVWLLFLMPEKLYQQRVQIKSGEKQRERGGERE